MSMGSVLFQNAGVQVNQPLLLREIFGPLPFRPVTIDPAWKTTNAIGIAKGISDDRRFQDMPILADALEEAGCDNSDILAHCRQPGVHVRGCWCLDLDPW